VGGYARMVGIGIIGEFLKIFFLFFFCFFLLNDKNKNALSNFATGFFDEAPFLVFFGISVEGN